MDTEGRIKLDQRINFALIEDMKRYLSEENLRKFQSSCFGHFLDLDRNIRFDKGLHHYLLRRQDTSDSINEVDFRIHGQWIKFGPREFALVTGLKFPENEMPSVSVSSLRLYDTYLNRYDKSQFKFPQLHAGFKGLTDFDSEDCLKIALLLVVYGILIAHHNHVLDLEYFSLVDDLEKFNFFPWGSLAYKFIIHDFRTRLSGRLESDSLLKPLTPIAEGTNSDETVEIHYKSLSLDVRGFPQALQYWALEAIPWLKHILNYLVDSTLPTVPARILRWKAGFMPRKKVPTAQMIAERSVRPNEQPVDLPYRLEPQEIELNNAAYLSTVQWEKFTSVSEQHKEPSPYKKRKRQSGEDNIEGSSDNQRIGTERSEQVGGQSVRGQDKDPSLAAIELKQTTLEEMIKQIRKGQRKMKDDINEAIARIESWLKTIEDGSERTAHEVNNLKTYCDAELKTIRSDVEGIKTFVKSSLETHTESHEFLERIQQELHDMVKGFAERLGITLGHRGSDRPQVPLTQLHKELSSWCANYESKVVDMEAENKRIKEELTLLTHKNKELSSQRANYESKVIDMEAENKRTKEELTALTHKDKELSSKCAKYESKVIEMDAENKRIKEELTALTHKNKELSSQRANYGSKVIDMEAENKRIKEELANCESKLVDMEAENMRTKEELTMLTQKNKELSSRCVNYDCKLVDMEAENKRTKEELTVLTRKNKAFSARCASYESQVTALNKVFSAQCASYKSQVIALEVENKKIKDELMNTQRKKRRRG